MDLYCTKAIHDRCMKTPSFLKHLNECWQRFCSKDWGNVSPETAKLNDRGSGQILGIYEIEGETIWFVEENRHVSVLYPSEY